MENTKNLITSNGKSMTEYRELVYDLMNGLINLDRNPVPESRYVENEYAERMECETLYAEAQKIKFHLFKRLGSDDDIELERMVDCLCEIGNLMSRRMFDYGWLFALKSLTAQRED
ncbi:MAG: hypothetical protein LUF92_05080 [Clostridiales bacterium]|nr:hypothetical protein [Clostridiales bacterium]